MSASSNLSNAAISSGLEWNIKVTKKDLSETIAKIAATFESYWNSSEFEYYDEGQRERLAKALKAAKYILDNIRASYASTAGLVSRIAAFEKDTGLSLSLANFLDYYHIEPRSIYKSALFSRLCVRAGVTADFSEPQGSIFKKAMMKLADINSRRWIVFSLGLLPNIRNFDLSETTLIEKRMVQMLVLTIWGRKSESWNDNELQRNLQKLGNSTVFISEFIELLEYRYDHIDFIDSPLDIGFDCPLDLHCVYTRDQILAAPDFKNPSTVRGA